MKEEVFQMLKEKVIKEAMGGIENKIRHAFNQGFEAGQIDRSKWRPASDPPPEEDGTYLIRTEGGYVCSCRWTNTNPFWTDQTTEWHWCIFDIPQYNKVAEWMPIPE